MTMFKTSSITCITALLFVLCVLQLPIGSLAQTTMEANPSPDLSIQDHSFAADPVDEGKDRFFGFGLFGGLTAATGWYIYEERPAPPALGMIFTPAAGIKMHFRFGKHFSFGSDLAFRIKGDRIDMGKWQDQSEKPTDLGEWELLETRLNGDVKTNIGYVEWSLYPAIHPVRGLTIAFGAYAGIGLYGSETADYSIGLFSGDEEIDSENVYGVRTIEFSDYVALEDSETIHYVNRLDYGLMGFIGIGRRPVSVNLGASYGLNPWEPEQTLFSSTVNTDETHPFCLMVDLTYWFL